MPLLPNIFGEWGQLCMFVAVKASFCCGICIVKANEKMDSSVYINNVVNSNHTCITTQLCSVLCLLELPVQPYKMKPSLIVKSISRNTHCSIHYN